MKGFGSLVKIFLTNIFVKSFKTNKKSQLWAWGALALFVYALITYGIVVMVNSFAQIFIEYGGISQLMFLLTAAGFIAVIILGLVSMVTTLYFSRDTEFLLTLPVKPSTIFLARMTVIYIGELLIAGLMLIPCFITIGVVAKMGVVFYLMSLLGVVCVPFFALIVASILAVPLMYLTSFFKNKGAMSSVIMILLFAVFFVGYFFVVGSSMNGSEGGEVDMGAVINSMLQGIDSAGFILYPIYTISLIATGRAVFGLSLAVSNLINIIILVGSCVALVAIAMAIAKFIFYRGISSQLENATSNSVGKKTYSANNISKSLMTLEWKELFRTPAFAFQCLSGIVITPIMLIFMTTMNKIDGVAGMPAEQLEMFRLIMIFVDVLLLSFMGIGMNIGASTAYSREGQKLYFSKILPITTKTQFNAKSTLYYIIGGMSILFGFIVMFITIPVSIKTALFLLSIAVILFIHNYVFVNFAMLFDLSKPKLDWSTPNEVVKNSRGAIVPLMLNLAFSILMFGVLPILAIMYIPNLTLAIVLIIAVLFAVDVALAITIRLTKGQYIDKFYANLSL